MQHARKFRRRKVGPIKQMKVEHQTWDLWAGVREDDNRNSWNIEPGVQFVEDNKRRQEHTSHVRDTPEHEDREWICHTWKHKATFQAVNRKVVTDHLRVNQISASCHFHEPDKTNNCFFSFQSRKICFCAFASKKVGEMWLLFLAWLCIRPSVGVQELENSRKDCHESLHRGPSLYVINAKKKPFS
jgi:hypothetical protein